MGPPNGREMPSSIKVNLGGGPIVIKTFAVNVLDGVDEADLE